MTSCEKKQEILLTAAKALARNSGIFIPFDLERASEKEIESFVKKVVKDIERNRR